MTGDLFRASRLKVNRARKHIAGASAEMEAAAKKHSDFQSVMSLIEGGITPERRLPQARLDEIACCVGDAVHNLRSSLDLLACEVVELSGQSPKGVHFPFAATEADLLGPKGMIAKRRFNRATPQAQTLLLTFGPHSGPNGDPLLRALHDLDLIDKHQDILTLSSQVSVPALFMDGMRLPARSNPAPKLVFAPGKILPGVEVDVALNDMARLADQIIDAFSLLF